MNKYDEEYLLENNSPFPGGNGKPYWNINSIKFMYVPKLHFPMLPHYDNYKYTVTDCNKKEYIFFSDNSESYLTPVWEKLPQGIIIVKVEALDLNNNVVAIMGVRTFYKSEGFKGLNHYKKAKRSYKKSAEMAMNYIINQDYIQYWLNNKTPDPSYDLYVYPSKMVNCIIRLMLDYAKLNNGKYDLCLKIARNAANYLIEVSNKNESIYKGLPVTYYYMFRKQYEGINNEMAKERIDEFQLRDPINACDALLYLYEETKENKYLDVALHMGNFLKENIKENGSFSMVYSLKDNKPIYENEMIPTPVIIFINHLYKITKDEKLLVIKEKCIKYIKKNILERRNFEGQFEDSARSDNYSNLSCIMALDCLEVLIESEDIKEMEELMRFVEDQFVIWDKPCPFAPSIRNPHIHDNSEFYYPAGLEQYQWYVPIDASTATIIKGYMTLYRKNNNPLLLEKAKVLANSITNMQNDENGLIPTQWFRKSCIEDGGDLWINCLIMTSNVLKEFDELLSK